MSVWEAVSSPRYRLITETRDATSPFLRGGVGRSGVPFGTPASSVQALSLSTAGAFSLDFPIHDTGPP